MWLWVLTIVALVLTAACDDAVDTPSFAGGATIRGIAAIGHVNSGTVNAYDYSNCTKNKLIATTQVNSDGSY